MQKSSQLWIESASNLTWKIRLPTINKALRFANHQLPTLLSNCSRTTGTLSRSIPHVTNAGMKNEEDAMITEKDLVPILHGAPHVQEILAASGFTHADWEALVNSELETSD